MFSVLSYFDQSEKKFQSNTYMAQNVSFLLISSSWVYWELKFEFNYFIIYEDCLCLLQGKILRYKILSLFEKLFSQTVCISSKVNNLIYIQKENNKVFKQSIKWFYCKHIFPNLKENQLVTVIISCRQHSFLFFNFQENWQLL